MLTGTVHSGVAMAMVKIAREDGMPTIVPNAGADVITRAMCAENVFRTSFGNGQIGLATGDAMIKAGHKKAVTVTWKYAAGEEMVNGFKKSFTAGKGEILKDITLAVPRRRIPVGARRDRVAEARCVYAFFAGGGALKFIKDYAAAKLGIPLWGPGFLTDGVEPAAGPAGNGIKTVLHYVGDLDNPENKAFVKGVQGRLQDSAGRLRGAGLGRDAVAQIGLKAVGGDVAKRKEMYAAMAEAIVQQPARAVPAVGVAQSDPEFLSARTEGRQEHQSRPRRRGGGRRSHRLQAGLHQRSRSRSTERGGAVCCACLFSRPCRERRHRRYP